MCCRSGVIVDTLPAAEGKKWVRKICTFGRYMQLWDVEISPCDEICGL